MMIYAIILVPIFIIMFALIGWYFFDRYKRHRHIALLSKFGSSSIIDNPADKKKLDEMSTADIDKLRAKLHKDRLAKEAQQKKDLLFN